MRACHNRACLLRGSQHGRLAQQFLDVRECGAFSSRHDGAQVDVAQLEATGIELQQPAPPLLAG
jgi:hypothetical protein